MYNKPVLTLAFVAILNLSSCSARKPEQPVETRTPSTQSADTNALYGEVVDFEKLVQKYGSEDAALEAIFKSEMVVIDFYATWCGPCQKLAPNFSAVAQQLPTVLCVKINAEHFDTVRQKFHVRSYPTLIFLHNGEKINSLSGLRSQKALVDEIEKTFKLQ